MPFMATGARDSALPIMHYHTVLSYPRSRGRHSHTGRETAVRELIKKTHRRTMETLIMSRATCKIKFLQ